MTTEIKYKKGYEWNPDILTEGGISYFYPKNVDNKELQDGTPFKEKYRVAMTAKKVFYHNEGFDKILKWKIRTASDETFSVAAKTLSEAQLVVDELFGKGHYRVSQMLC